MSKEELKITKAAVVKAHEEAGKKGKLMLENLFGAPVFSKSVFDRLQTFEAVCLDQGKDPSDYFIPTNADHEEIAAINFKKARLIIKALNEGWIPDYTNSSQAKFEPRFVWSASAGAFVYGDYVCWYSLTAVGARLVLRTSELCAHYGKYFGDIHNEILKPEPIIIPMAMSASSSPQSIFQQACASKNIDPETIIHPMDKLAIIIAFKNGDWIADYSDSTQWKYEPRFEWSASAGAFVCYGCDCWTTVTAVGARLSYKDLATLKSAVAEPEIMELYNQILKK